MPMARLPVQRLPLPEAGYVEHRRQHPCPVVLVCTVTDSAEVLATVGTARPHAIGLSEMRACRHLVIDGAPLAPIPVTCYLMYALEAVSCHAGRAGLPPDDVLAEFPLGELISPGQPGTSAASRSTTATT